MPPGFDWARAMNSRRFCAGTEGWVIITFGTEATMATGAKSFTGS